MAESPLWITFERLGRDTTAAKDWSINSSYLVSTDGFEFTLYEANRDLMRGLELEPVALEVNGCNQLLGRIDQTEIGGDGTAVTCRGRDYISDIVECNIDPSFQVKDGMTVSDAILLAARPCGISQLQSDADIAMRNIRTGKSIAAPKPPRDFITAKLEDLKPKNGEGIYEFCNRIAARHSATIQPANTRDTLILAAPQYRQSPIGKLERYIDTRKSVRNNILNATATRDYSRFPTFTMAHGKHGKSGEKTGAASRMFDMAVLAGEFNSEMADRIDGTIIGGRQRPDTGKTVPPQLYRLLYVDDDQGRNDDQFDAAAKRALAERLKDTLEYRCTVDGHIDMNTGAVWSIDTIIEVVDEICDVNEPLWVAERTLKFSAEDGATTELVMWRPESFQI